MRIRRHIPTYAIAINGTITEETLAILLMPPMTTSPTNRATTIAVITVTIEYSVPRMFTACFISGSKKLFVAEAIPLTCVNVPIPMRPTQVAKTAKHLASHFHFLPMPFSI